MAYGDKNLFYKFFLFLIENLDFPIKIRPEKGVWWIYSFGQEWNIFILPFLDTLGYTLFQKYGVWLGQLFSYFGCFEEPCHVSK